MGRQSLKAEWGGDTFPKGSRAPQEGREGSVGHPGVPRGVGSHPDGPRGVGKVWEVPPDNRVGSGALPEGREDWGVPP